MNRGPQEFVSFKLTLPGVEVRDANGHVVEGPIELNLPVADHWDPMAPCPDVVDAVGPEAAAMLREQFVRAVAGQLLAASLR